MNKEQFNKLDTSIYGTSLDFNGVPVDVLPYAGPILEVHLMDTLESGLGYVACVPYKNSLGFYSNFGTEFPEDMYTWISDMILSNPNIKKVVIKSNQP